MNKIEVKNLCFAYNKDSDMVINHISFRVKEGSYVSIIGHNGSGKSTLARLLIGLLAPSDGEIYVADQLVTSKNIKSIRQKIGLVFQNPDNQFIGATVEDDIKASCRVCLVEVKGARGLCASCVYPVNEGMEISISSNKAVEARRASVELILSNHEKNCLQCPKNGHCELLHVAEMVGARDGKYVGQMTPKTYDEVAPGIIMAQCISIHSVVHYLRNGKSH